MEFVETLEQLKRASALLRGADRFYLDTEFESSRAGKRLSLVQICAERTHEQTTAELPVVIFDALRLGSLLPLKEVLTSPEVEWVLHAGLQDIELLIDALALSEAPRLFDTQIAWGLLGPEASVSLSYLEFRVLGIRKMKTHQADDWMRRPLPRTQLEYAAHDVLHLPAIAKELGRRADLLQRRAIIEQASVAQLLPEPEPVEQLSLQSFRNAWQLEPRNLAALLSLIDWHNGQAERPRLAPKAFLSIASRLPRTAQDLMRIKGVPPQFVAQHGREFLRRLQAAVATVESEGSAPLTPLAYASYRELHIEARLWLMRARVCETLSVAAELTLPNKLLHAMQDRIVSGNSWPAALDALAGWRRQLLEAEVAAFLDAQSRDFPL